MTYRDDLQAARMRREALARELREVRSRMDGYRELAEQEQALERELAQCARDIEQAPACVALPLRPRVRVASPCKERWDEMTGDEHVRFCGRCEKNVYDLSSLSASQAEALLRERGESMCVQFFRSDGMILTGDCPVGARRKSVWRRVAGAAVAGGLAAVALAGAGAPIGVEGTDEVPPALLDEQIEAVVGNLSFVAPEMTAVELYKAEREHIDGQIEAARISLYAAVTEAERRPIQQRLALLHEQAESVTEHLARLAQQNAGR
ncbi:MAG TPA: hypothetical protein VNM90_18405 [Haliangium sp.]|nr:hypothetical protein [Haliangium sp.]